MHGFFHIGVNLVGLRSPIGDTLRLYIQTVAERMARSEATRITLFCSAESLEAFGPLRTGSVEVVHVRGEGLMGRSAQVAARLRAEAVDVVWAPTLRAAHPFHRSLPQVVTVHHLREHWLPRHYKPLQRLRSSAMVAAAAASARRLITTSDFTRQSLVRRYRVPHSKVVTVHEGASLPEQGLASNPETTLQRLGMRPPFFVYPAADWAHKNHRRLVESFARFRQRTRSSVRLLLWGSRNQSWSHCAHVISALGLDGAVVHLGELEHREARDLMSVATALVFPSEGEGFGRAIVDAQSVGTPVIAAADASNPEVVGAGGVLVGARDIPGWARAFERVTSDHALKERLVRLGTDNVARFDWTRAAGAMVHELRKVAGAL